MTKLDQEDEVLGERFAAWRVQDSARVPGFERVVRGRERAPSRVWRRAVFAFAAAGLITVGVLWTRTPSSVHGPGTLAFTPGSLRVPTDFLLDQVVTLDVGAVPAIGDVNWYPLSRTDTTVTTKTSRRN